VGTVKKSLITMQVMWKHLDKSTNLDFQELYA